MRYPEHPSPQAMTAEINRLGHLTLREEGLSFYVQSADSIGKIRDGSMTTETTRDLDAGRSSNSPSRSRTTSGI